MRVCVVPELTHLVHLHFHTFTLPHFQVPIELSIRAEFKLASYSEFSLDWKQAVLGYRAAYTHITAAVTQLITSQTPAIQSDRINPSSSHRHSSSWSSSSALAPHTHTDVHTSSSHYRSHLHTHSDSHLKEVHDYATSSIPTQSPSSPSSTAPLPQRWFELCKTAELLHLKLLMLLMHQSRLEEAAQQVSV